MPRRWVDEHNTAHELCVLVTFVQQTCLGETQIDPGDCPELGWPRSGVALFCRDCGDVWARLSLVDSTGRCCAFSVVEAPCEQHQSQWEISGSLLAAGEGWLKYLPPLAVKRELTQHLRAKGIEL